MFLSLAGIICKILGLALRVPMSSESMLGLQGVGLYQLAYPIYQLLVAVSTAGLPAAISKQVAHHLAQNDPAGARMVFIVARRLLLLLGIVLTIIMLAAAPVVGSIIGDKGVVPSILALAPSLLFVAVICSYRGYFQGMQRMVPTAWSQIIEQGVQLVIALILIRLFIHKGIVVAAAMALVGATAAEGVAMLYMMWDYRRNKWHYDAAIAQQRAREKAEGIGPRERRRSPRTVQDELLKFALPITLGALLMPLVTTIDSFLFNNIVKGQGVTADAARAMYGALTSDAQTLVNMPAVISVALSMSLVPAISDAMARRDHGQLQRRVDMGLRLSIMLSLPCMLGMMVLAGPLTMLLYPSRSAEHMQLSSQLMAILSPSLLGLCIMQTGNAILQGMGKVKLPVRNLLIGAVVKVVLDLCLIGPLGVKGAAIATVGCYTVAGVLNLIQIAKNSPEPIQWNLRGFAAPTLSSLGMGVVLALVFPAFLKLGLALSNGMNFSAARALWVGDAIAVLLAFLLGVVLYFFLLIMMRGLSKDDCALLPGGKYLARFLR